MPAFPLKRNLHVAIGCALAGALLVAATPAAAQQSDTAPEVEFLDSFMGILGMSRKADAPINYRERSPLVLPQGDNLPPPESAKVTNPNWPVDPEVKEARALAATQNPNDGRTASQRMDDGGRPLLPAELNKGRVSRKQNNAGGGERSSGDRLNASELGYKGGLFGTMFGRSDRDQATAFVGEAPRTSLIEPPAGYQTPSPAQPYASGKSVDKLGSQRIGTYDPKYEKY
jgi:hypothetical protein